LILLFFCILISCSREEFLIELQYNEPGCYKPWGTTEDINKIRTFLRSKDILPLKIYRKFIYPPETIFCMSCGCPTGYAIFITVLPNDEQKALNLGFFNVN
jgi:hypothetical protein